MEMANPRGQKAGRRKTARGRITLHYDRRADGCFFIFIYFFSFSYFLLISGFEKLVSHGNTLGGLLDYKIEIAA